LRWKPQTACGEVEEMTGFGVLGVEIDDAVSADSPVENTETVCGSGAKQLGCGHHGVSPAESAEIVRRACGIAVPAAIGDRIALEEDGAIFWNHAVGF
jgi:hypothetical protein